MTQEAISGVVLPRKQTQKQRVGKRLAAAFVIFALIVLGFLAYIGFFNGNVRTVDPGRVYRSAQLSGSSLENTLKQYGIRTVINLRGGSISDSWYRSEREISDRLGIRHLDISMSAIKLPPPDRMKQLIAAFDSGPYPILFHCQGGADRSGLTGTVYKNVYENVPLDRAEADQLTWRYGHMSFTRTQAMDYFFTLYRQTGAGMSLRDWIETRYPSVYDAQPSYLKMDPGDARVSDPIAPPATKPAKGNAKPILQMQGGHG